VSWALATDPVNRARAPCITTMMIRPTTASVPWCLLLRLHLRSKSTSLARIEWRPGPGTPAGLSRDGCRFTFRPPGLFGRRSPVPGSQDCQSPDDHHNGSGRGISGHESSPRHWGPGTLRYRDHRRPPTLMACRSLWHSLSIGVHRPKPIWTVPLTNVCWIPEASPTVHCSIWLPAPPNGPIAFIGRQGSADR